MAAQVVYADFNSLTPKRDEIYRNPNIWAQKPNQYQNQDVTDTRRDSRTLDLRRSAWSPCCSSCCSCLLFLLGCLIVAGLAAAVALPIIFKPSDSTSTTEAVIVFSNDNTTTSTISTTTTESTSTSTNTTTATTKTTTSSTATTATSTTTTSTKTTTSTTATTTTTTANACMAGYTNSIQLLYLSLNAYIGWTTYTYNFTSPNVTALTLMFSFRSDPTYWYLDDVKVSNSSGTQLLTNYNFESGSFGNWTYCNPKNTTYAGVITSSSNCNGNYCYRDGSIGGFDYLRQTFKVQPNENYGVQFKLRLDPLYIVNATFASISLLY